MYELADKLISSNYIRILTHSSREDCEFYEHKLR